MPRILLLEEDQPLSDLIRLFCEDEGYTVVAVQTLAGAIEQLAAEPFDLVLRDSLVAAPEQFFEVVDPLLAAPDHPPIVVLTGHQFDPTSLQARGYTGLITKPFDLDELGRALRRVLGGAEPR